MADAPVAFDPSSAQQETQASSSAFDPTSARPAAGGFDPTSARAESSSAPGSGTFNPAGARLQTTPRALYTPHDYDGVILAATHGSPVSPDLLRAIGMQETGLGYSALYDRKMGVSRATGNRGHGIWQLDPASGASPADLARAASDPAFAAQRATQMLGSLYQRYGDWRKALAAYNAGDPNAPTGQRYADSVLAMQANLDPIHAPPSPLAQVGKHLEHVAAQGENTLRRNWDFARSHPIDELGDILGFAQRGAGALIGQVERPDPHHPVVSALKAIAHDIFHPGDLVRGQDATARGTEAVRALLHAPTHEAIADFVKAHVSHDLQPYVAAILKGGEDFAFQTASDPLTYVPGIDIADRGVAALRALSSSLKGAQATRALAALAHSEGALKLLPWLPKLEQTYTKVATAAAHVFRPRPELDAVLDENGRHARLQIEARNRTAASRDLTYDQQTLRAADPAVLRQRYLQYLHDTAPTAEEQQILARMGSGRPITAPVGNLSPNAAAALSRSLRSKLGGFLSLSPDEMGEEFNRLREALRSSRTAQETSAHLAQFGGYAPGTAAMTADQWRAFERTHSSSLEEALSKSPGGKAVLTLTSLPRSLAQAALFLNPLPHGMKNVGQLAYLAGGLRVVPHAIGSMAQAFTNFASRGAAGIAGGIEPAMLRRLEQMGAAPSYTRDLTETLWAKMIPGWGAAANKLQDAMTVMEHSWRSALLEELDRKLGPSKTAADELAKGFMVNDRIGDYHNQSAFVQLFQMMGGPFVAFRLGIVPKNVATAIAHNPERVLAIIRAQQDIQRNRSARGQRDNTLTLGGPTDDFAKLVFTPDKFLTSPATTGALGQVGSTMQQAQQRPFGDVAAQIASRYDPTAEVREMLGHAIGGTGMPAPSAHGHDRYQPESLADRLVTASLESLAIYYAKQQSAASKKAQRAQERRVEREGP